MEEVLRGFFLEMFCQLKTIASREVLYNDYVSFCCSRNKAPMNIKRFENRLNQAFDKVLKGFSR